MRITTAKGSVRHTADFIHSTVEPLLSAFLTIRPQTLMNLDEQVPGTSHLLEIGVRLA